MEPPDFKKRILNFDRLLDGENRDHYTADDALHWRSVYTDLVGFKKELLSQTREHIEEVPATETELGGVDIPFLKAEMQRLQRGLAFWDAAKGRSQ